MAPYNADAGQRGVSHDSRGLIRRRWPPLAELLRAMRLGFTYANVHSTICPSGEVREQIRP